MKTGYYITSNGERVILKSQTILDLSYRNIVELVIPEGCKYVSCWSNQLTELVIPEGCETVYCNDNRLTKLIIPDGCEKVFCDYYLGDKYYDEWKDSTCKIELF